MLEKELEASVEHIQYFECFIPLREGVCGKILANIFIPAGYCVDRSITAAEKMEAPDIQIPVYVTKATMTATQSSANYLFHLKLQCKLKRPEESKLERGWAMGVPGRTYRSTDHVAPDSTV